MKKQSRINKILIKLAEEAKPKYYTENPLPTSWKAYNFDKEKGVRYMANVMHVVRIFKPLPKEITAAETGMLLACIPFIEAETGMLYYRSNTVNKPMSISRLSAKVGKSASHIYRFVRRMCELRIMAKEKHCLYVNPIYFFRGRYLPYHLYDLFKPELDAVLPRWVIDKYNGTMI